MPRPRPPSRRSIAPPTNWGHLVALGVCGAAIHLGPLAASIWGQSPVTVSTPAAAAPAPVAAPMVHSEPEQPALDW